MTGIRKRIIACGMALLLALSLLPPQTARAVWDGSTRPEDVWAAIGDLEQAGLDGAAALMKAGADPAKDPDYYASLSEEVEDLVTARPDYEPGSVIRHGAFFFWKDTAGVVYGYSPNLRAQLHGAWGPEEFPEELDDEASNWEAEIAVLEQAQAARAETASEGAVLMGGTTTDPDVAVFIPHYPDHDSRFTKSAYYRGLQIAEATGGACTCEYDTGVTIDKLADALTENGVILFHTHGDTDTYPTAPGNTAYITLTNSYGIDWETDGAKATGPHGEYHHAFSYGDGTYAIDGAAIVNHVKGKVVTGLFGLCCCLGMQNDGLCRPLREAGVEVVYGYTRPVTFSTDILHQRFLAEALVQGMNGAGIARYMKEQMCQFGLEHWTLTDDTRKNLTSLGSICWDPYCSDSFTEEQARNKGDAFLLFCSPEDPYPAEGQRNHAQTVKSAWRLSLSGGGTGSGNIRSTYRTGTEIERFFPNAAKMELLSGSLPGTVAIKTRKFAGEKIDALCGSVGDVLGYYDATFRVTFSNGATGTRRAEFLVYSSSIEFTLQTFVAETGKEQEVKFDFGDPGEVFTFSLQNGELPPGMSEVRDETGSLSLQGRPVQPGWYVSLWLIYTNSGKKIFHTVKVHVPGTEVETSESFLSSIYHLSSYDLAVQDPSAVVQMDLLSGSLPPGMNWTYSSSKAPCISGQPTEEGSYSARFRFLCSDGTIQYHTVNVSTFVPGHPLSSYTVYVGGGKALVPKKDFDDVLLHTLMGAVNAKLIKWSISGDGSEVHLDLDNNGSYDVVTTLPEGNFVLFRKVSGCSITSDTFELTLNDAAITQASSFGNYAEEIVFRLADRFDLYVDGTQVTTGNMQNILGNGVFSFDGGVTLSVHGDYSAVGSEPVIRNEMPNLVVQVDDDSTLRSKTDCIRTSEHMTIRGTGNLILQAEKNGIVNEGALVELLNLDLAVKAGEKGICSDGSGTPHARIIRSNVELDSGTGAMYGFWSIVLDHCTITNPVYGQVEKPLPVESGSYQCLVDENRNLLTRAAITAWQTKYDLQINGIQVTDWNQTDVLGDGKFSYDEESNVLNVSGSLESGETIVSSEIDGLKIIAAPDTVLKTSDRSSMALRADTTLSGGPLTVISTSKFGQGIMVDSDSTLTVSNMDMTVQGGRFGINAAGDAENRLTVQSSNVTASGPSGAIRKFTAGGIKLFDCVLWLPAEGQSGTGTVMDGENAAAQAVILRNSVSVSGKVLSYSLYLPGSGSARLIAAWYDADGKMLGTALTEAPRGSMAKGTIPVKAGADTYQLFALDGDSGPIFASIRTN